VANTTVKRFGIEGATAAAIGLVATAIQWKYPEYKSLANGMLALAGLIMLGAIIAAIVRSMTIREYERRHPVAEPAQQLRQTFKPVNTNTFQPTVNVSVPVNQTQSRQERERRTAPSVFEATDNTRVVRYFFDAQTGRLIREPYYGREEDMLSQISPVNTALAQFHYRHDEGVEPSLNVAAHIFVYDPAGKPLKPILYHTVWDNLILTV